MHYWKTRQNTDKENAVLRCKRQRANEQRRSCDMLPMCVYARCTAPAICQHSVVTSVEGGTHRLGVCGCVCIREREIEREREISEPYTPAISHIHVSFCHLFICMAVTDLIMALAPLQPVLPTQHSGMEFRTCALVLHRVRTHTPARITNYCRCPLLQT